jgi:FdrA protein
LAAAMESIPGANIALVSVAGRYAGGVALEALQRGLHVFLFSDNVPVEEEIALKKLAVEKGLLMMGPDAGTAIINNIALGFSNAVPKGPVGVVAASGTGLQSVTSALARNGVGITQAIGTGGRDLSVAVGGLAMLEGLKALQADSATKIILVVSKPPDRMVAEKVLAQVRNSNKPTIVCFLGGDSEAIRAAGATPAPDLESAAQLTLALAQGRSAENALDALSSRGTELRALAETLRLRLMPGQRYLRGLFSGGTFCYESQLILRDLIGPMNSNASVERKYKLADSNKSEAHTVIDLGEDEFTVGRLHPMIDPTLRNRRIVHEALDPETALILLDVVLGYGAHPDPAQAAVDAIHEAREVAAGREILFIASVCGTSGDPQVLDRQEATLRGAGVIVLPSNAAATRLAGYILAPLGDR